MASRAEERLERPGAMADTGVEVLPGTEIMRDVAGVHFVHAHGSPDSAVLVPQPSNNLNDPLVSPFSCCRNYLYLTQTELELKMEVHSHRQSSGFRLRQPDWDTINCTTDAYL